MATSTASYFQTLSSDETHSFVVSLQKIKEHLSGELEWMNQQVQQKTLQLQGIETLLSEAITLGLVSPDLRTELSLPPVPETVASSAHSAPETVEAVDDSISTVSLNGNAVSETNTSTEDSTSPATTTPKAKPDSTKSKQKQSSKKPTAKTQSKTQTAAASKASATKTKQFNHTSKSTAKGKTASGNQDLRGLLQPKFGDKTFKEIVIQILADANKPLHLNDMIQEMYGSLSGEDLKRAKGALMNVLSAGKGDGRWQNLGQGMYTAKGVATA